MTNIEYRILDELKNYEENSKKHPQQQVDKIKMSIIKFGFNVPIIVDKDNLIIAGHGRSLALHQLRNEDCNILDFNKIPVIVKDNLSNSDIKAYRIMDNRSAESDWDNELLISDLKELNNGGYDLDYTGFSFEEFQNLLPDYSVKNEVENVDKTFERLITCPKCGTKFKKGDEK